MKFISGVVTCVDHKTGHDDPRTKQNMFRQLLAAVVSWRLGLMSGDAVMDWLSMIEPVFFLKRRDSILLSTKTLIKASPVKLQISPDIFLVKNTSSTHLWKIHMGGELGQRSAVQMSLLQYDRNHRGGQCLGTRHGPNGSRSQRSHREGWTTDPALYGLCLRHRWGRWTWGPTKGVTWKSIRC